MLQILLERLDLGATLPEAIARAAGGPAEHRHHHREPAFISSPEGQAARARHRTAAAVPPLPTAEIGAVTGIEFLSGGRTLAAAEPVRRGGGSAAVVEP